MKTRETGPHVSSRENRSVAILKYIQSFCSPQQGLPSRETNLQMSNLLRFYQSLTTLGKGKYPTHVHYKTKI